MGFSSIGYDSINIWRVFRGIERGGCIFSRHVCNIHEHCEYSAPQSDETCPSDKDVDVFFTTAFHYYSTRVDTFDCNGPTPRV